MLVDRGHVVSGSTPILLYMEEQRPEPALLSLADITLATMTAPLQYAGRAVRDDPDVRPLLEWGARVLGNDFSPLGAPAAVQA